jgi:hypothetical protein
MGVATDLIDKIGVDSKKVKWFFMAFLSYLILNIIGITDSVPILDGLKISASTTFYSWFYSIIIIVFILLLYEDGI